MNISYESQSGIYYRESVSKLVQIDPSSSSNLRKSFEPQPSRISSSNHYSAVSSPSIEVETKQHSHKSSRTQNGSSQLNNTSRQQQPTPLKVNKLKQILFKNQSYKSLFNGLSTVYEEGITTTNDHEFAKSSKAIRIATNNTAACSPVISTVVSDSKPEMLTSTSRSTRVDPDPSVAKSSSGVLNEGKKYIIFPDQSAFKPVVVPSQSSKSSSNHAARTYTANQNALRQYLQSLNANTSNYQGFQPSSNQNTSNLNVSSSRPQPQYPSNQFINQAAATATPQKSSSKSSGQPKHRSSSVSNSGVKFQPTTYYISYANSKQDIDYANYLYAESQAALKKSSNQTHDNTKSQASKPVDTVDQTRSNLPNNNNQLTRNDSNVVNKQPVLSSSQDNKNPQPATSNIQKSTSTSHTRSVSLGKHNLIPVEKVSGNNQPVKDSSHRTSRADQRSHNPTQDAQRHNNTTTSSPQQQIPITIQRTPSKPVLTNLPSAQTATKQPVVVLNQTQLVKTSQNISSHNKAPTTEKSSSTGGPSKSTKSTQTPSSSGSSKIITNLSSLIAAESNTNGVSQQTRTTKIIKIVNKDSLPPKPVTTYQYNNSAVLSPTPSSSRQSGPSVSSLNSVSSGSNQDQNNNSIRTYVPATATSAKSANTLPVSRDKNHSQAQSVASSTPASSNLGVVPVYDKASGEIYFVRPGGSIKSLNKSSFVSPSSNKANKDNQSSAQQASVKDQPNVQTTTYMSHYKSSSKDNEAQDYIISSYYKVDNSRSYNIEDYLYKPSESFTNKNNSSGSTLKRSATTSGGTNGLIGSYDHSKSDHHSTKRSSSSSKSKAENTASNSDDANRSIEKSKTENLLNSLTGILLSLNKRSSENGQQRVPKSVKIVESPEKLSKTKSFEPNSSQKDFQSYPKNSSDYQSNATNAIDQIFQAISSQTDQPSNKYSTLPPIYVDRSSNPTKSQKSSKRVHYQDLYDEENSKPPASIESKPQQTFDSSTTVDKQPEPVKEYKIIPVEVKEPPKPTPVLKKYRAEEVINDSQFANSHVIEQPVIVDKKPPISPASKAKSERAKLAAKSVEIPISISSSPKLATPAAASSPSASPPVSPFKNTDDNLLNENVDSIIKTDPSVLEPAKTASPQKSPSPVNKEALTSPLTSPSPIKSPSPSKLPVEETEEKFDEKDEPSVLTEEHTTELGDDTEGEDESAISSNPFNIFESNQTVGTNLNDDLSILPLEQLLPKTYVKEFNFGAPKFKRGYFDSFLDQEQRESDTQVQGEEKRPGDEFSLTDEAAELGLAVEGDVDTATQLVNNDDDVNSQFYAYQLSDAESDDLNAATYGGSAPSNSGAGLIHSSSNPKLSSFAKRSEPIPEEDEIIEEEEEYEDEYEEEYEEYEQEAPVTSTNDAKDKEPNKEEPETV